MAHRLNATDTQSSGNLRPLPLPKPFIITGNAHTSHSSWRLLFSRKQKLKRSSTVSYGVSNCGISHPLAMQPQSINFPTNHANPPDFAKDRVIFLETLQQEKGREVRLSSGDYGQGETIKQEHCDLGFRDSLLFLAAGTIFLANPMLTSSLGPSCHCTPMGET